jgi:hypothetical protein
MKIENCLNCEEIQTDTGVKTISCYECYILSGDEERDIQKAQLEKIA